MTKSEMLLGRLIEERLTPGADTAEIDRRITAYFEEEWCIVFTDMEGFSRHGAEQGIVPLLCLIHELKRTARPIIEQNGGFVIKTIADSFLILFRRAPDALQCLLQLNRALAAYNAGRDRERQIEIGAGIGFGRILKLGDEDVYGVEVNYAARLGEDLAKPGEILMTDAARAAVLYHPDVEIEPVGIELPFAAFRVRYDRTRARSDEPASSPQPL